MNPAIDKLRFMLLQARKDTDPMRAHEIDCFAWGFGCSATQFKVVDLLVGVPSPAQLRASDVILIGGSGDYSTTNDCDWLDRSLDLFRDLHDQSKPTFGSCWGFQALAKAMGGTVIRDRENAELGTPDAFLTPAGKNDPIFSPSGDRFAVYIGHEDRVVSLPDDAVSLVATDRVNNQALRFEGKPIYATQFHAELHRETFMDRIRAYPKYVEQISGLKLEQFYAQCPELPHNYGILRRFAHLVFEQP